MIERALKEGWPLPDHLRPALIDRLGKIVTNKRIGPREVTSAPRAILEASRINLDVISATIRAEEHEELAADVEELKQWKEGCEADDGNRSGQSG
jgi:hypothetical protein